MNNQKITYIQDLPDLDEIQMPPSHHQSQPQLPKSIRPNFRPSLESGMMDSPYTQSVFIEDEQPKLPNPLLYDTPNCIVVSNHIQMCPICSKFYNNDKSLYVITIVLLAIICIMLMKRVLNL